ncbi:hypothetical protein [Endozoicomonas sp. ALC013]|uniref:hypothetical protein n=1 Tax=Endozoicomonas sp. ALC013 TaxID=3403076 RepID=UPI003BB6609D
MIQQPIQQSIQQPIYDSASQCSGNGVEHSWLGHGVAVAKAFAKSLIPMEDPHFSINPDKTLEDIGRLATATILPLSPILFMRKILPMPGSVTVSPGRMSNRNYHRHQKQPGKRLRKKNPARKTYPFNSHPQPAIKGVREPEDCLHLVRWPAPFTMPIRMPMPIVHNP